VHGLSIGDISGDLSCTFVYFLRGGGKNLWHRISGTLCQSGTKFGRVRDLANRNLVPEIRELCGVVQGMEWRNFRRGRHLYSAGRPSRWESAHILFSFYCVARGLGASFLYKCPASRGSSLGQHDLHVFFVIPTSANLPRPNRGTDFRPRLFDA